MEKAKEFFANYLGFILVGLLAIAYIFMGIYEIAPKQKSIIEIIGDSAMVFVVSVSINTFMKQQGLITGEQQENYIKTVETYRNTVIAIEKDSDRLDEYCEIVNNKKRKELRTYELVGAGIPYDMVFDENG